MKKLANSNSSIEFQPLPQDDPKQRKPDIAKAQRVLGWAPKVEIEEGLKETLTFFQTRLNAV